MLAAEKKKGRDIGYAPTINSCEGVNSVDTCTITALDVITAFAVPNPNGSSQSPSVFSGLVALQVAPLSRLPSLLRSDKILFKPILSAVDRVNLNSCFIVVNAAFQCKVESSRRVDEKCNHLNYQYLVNPG